MMDDFQRQQRELKEKERGSQRQAAAARSSFASVPSLQEAEQFKLKKLKEQDRKSKLQAQQLHQSYQDTKSTAEAKASLEQKQAARRKQQQEAEAMRRHQHLQPEEKALQLQKRKEEERRQRRASQEQAAKVQLNTLTKVGKKEKKARASLEHLPPVEKRATEDVSVAEGTVQEKRDVFHHDFSPDRAKIQTVSSSTGMASMPSYDSENDRAVETTEDSSEKYVEHIGSAEESLLGTTPSLITDDREEEDAVEEAVTESEEPAAVVESTATEPPVADEKKADKEQSTLEEKEEAPAVVVVESEPVKEEEAPVVESPAAVETEVAPVAATTPDVVEEEKEEPPVTEEEVPSIPATTTPVEPGPPEFKTRLDVLFSFGLLTSSEKPYLDNYMNAVEYVVQSTLVKASKSRVDKRLELAANVKYDPAYGPFVQEYAKDDTYVDVQQRPNVQRILVIAAIPLFLTSDISIKRAREGICTGLQTSMRNGEFIALAKRGGTVVES
eukprot:CAMPEP_0172454800 /NCGR_PEP_ID=MMETSP1065-20121228/11686_1 /TAXON_ID=265537 /ORGANISM="Amphiprora paludosa, Strain CCMP125" /LENGTH=498 /DNA_ID=CAMNT_0013207195 /DNA_START=14 /DNA_END=1510 /DNA_ORIENTATION=+